MPSFIKIGDGEV